MTPRAAARAFEARVVGTEHVGAYVLVRLAGDDLDPGVPGQFLMARDPEGEAYLPRPVGALGLGGGDAGILVDPGFAVGALAGARRLQLLGPLGRGYALDGAAADRTLLVAGGIGVTALAGVPHALGGRPHLVAGFRLAAQAHAVELLDAEPEVVLAPQLVLDPLERRLQDDDVELVLAAGPLPMMRAVAGACRMRGIACQVALEAPMACGFGACFGCAVELDGRWQRLCLEGPVVDAGRLA